MGDSILTALGEPFAKRLGGLAIGGTAVFWAIGLAAYLLRFGPPQCGTGSDAPPGSAMWCQLSRVGALGVVLGILLCIAVVVGSSLLVGALSARLTTLIAGVGWPASGPLAGLTRWRTRAHAGRRARLATAPIGRPSQEAAVNRRLHRYATEEVAPTRVGNALAAMSERIADRHGFRLSMCWQALLAVLSEGALAQLGERSTTLLNRTQALVWSLLSTTWLLLLPPTWWAGWLLAAIIATVVSYLGLCYAAEDYADLVEGIVVTNRVLLYQAVGFTPPNSTGSEPELGRLLSRYLAGGQIDAPLSW